MLNIFCFKILHFSDHKSNACWEKLKIEIMYNYVTKKSKYLYAFSFKECKHIHKIEIKTRESYIYNFTSCFIFLPTIVL